MVSEEFWLKFSIEMNNYCSLIQWEYHLKTAIGWHTFCPATLLSLFISIFTIRLKWLELLAFWRNPSMVVAQQSSLTFAFYHQETRVTIPSLYKCNTERMFLFLFYWCGNLMGSYLKFKSNKNESHKGRNECSSLFSSMPLYRVQERCKRQTDFIPGEFVYFWLRSQGQSQT